MLDAPVLIHGTYRTALVGELISIGYIAREPFEKRSSGYGPVPGAKEKAWIPSLRNPLRPRIRELLLLYDKVIFDAGYDDQRHELISKLRERNEFEIYTSSTEERMPLAEIKPYVVPWLKSSMPWFFDVINKQKSKLRDAGYKKRSLKIFGRNTLPSLLYDLAHKTGAGSNMVTRPRIIKTLTGHDADSIVWFMAETDIQHKTKEISDIIRIASSNNASIATPSDPQFDQIGLESVKSSLKSYAVLRIELSSVLGELPRMNSLRDAIDIRRNETNALMDLRGHVKDLTNFIVSGTDVSMSKAAAEKASQVASVLSTSRKSTTISKWSTYVGVPISVAELIVGIPVGGIAIGIAGAMGQFWSQHIEDKSRWTTLVR